MKGNPHRPDMVARAECIINGISPQRRAIKAYSSSPRPEPPKQPSPSKPTKAKHLDKWLDISIIASCLILAATLLSQL